MCRCLSKKLENMTKELQKATMELEKETEKSDSLLKELLPANVADQLRRGLTVETRKTNINNDSVISNVIGILVFRMF